MWRIFFIVLLAVCGGAHAAKRYSDGTAPPVWHSSVSAACNDALGKKNQPANNEGYTWRIKSVDEPNTRCFVERRPVDGSDLVWRDAGVWTMVWQEYDNLCEAKMGQETTLQFKLGWAMYFNNPDGGTIRTADGGSVTPIPPMGKPPFEICQAGCVAVGGSTSSHGQFADMSTLANGHVQIVEVRDYSFNGKECTNNTDTDLSGSNPGSDGGQPGGGDGGDGDDGDGGDSGGGSGGDPPGGGNQNPPGTPPAPNPDGGDPGDGPGGGSGGNNDQITEAQCGVAGKPPCTAQIDETGTPTGPGDKMNRDNIDRQYDKLKDGLSSIWNRSDKDTSWGVVPNWFASTGCTPWSFGDIKGVGFTIDYCPAVPYAKGATTFMWVVVTFFAVLAMVGRTVGAGT